MTKEKSLFQDRARSAGAPDLYAYKTADETVSASTTFQADDHLFATVTAGRTYVFRFILFITSASATIADGIKLDFEASTCTVTNFKASVDFGQGGSGASAWVSALNTSMTDGGSSVSLTATIEGSIEPATTGTLALSWAQGTAAGNTTIKRGSSLFVWRVA